jgi:hypothetical protein
MILEKTILKKHLTKKNIQLKNLKKLKYYKTKLSLIKNIYNNVKQKKIYKKIIKYIITIKYYRTSTSITASEIDGKTFFIYISKPNLTKKNRKINKKINIKNSIKTLIKNCPFIINEPIALHLINVGYEKNLILKSFSKFFILIYKIFNINAHNGCRPAKKRRIKQRTKKFFTFSKITKKKLFLEVIEKNILNKIIKN